tara:strand:- start:779 stop:1174 length:396 start_codon:yes stop_codon:yes gene_type:complete
MKGLSPKFPLVLNTAEITYQLNVSYKEMIAQNLKNLLLTSPGERVMEPNFGVGLRNYFFEPLLPETLIQIRENVYSQVGTYMPFVEIIDVEFFESDDVGANPNMLSVKIMYAITPLQEVDTLSINNDFLTS